MQIEAAVTNAQGAPFAIESVELGEIAPNEVLVDVAAAGICHTDLIVRDQWYPVPLPAVLGHEGAGTVAAVGASVTSVTVGDRVAMSFDSCGGCPSCLIGRPSYCHHFFEHNFASARPDGSTSLSRDGEVIHSHFFGQSAFATRAVATERNVVPIPADVPFSIAAPFGCGIQTGAGAILNAMRPPSGSSVAIFGSGTVGISAILAARICGAGTVIAIDTRSSRLELARELGATHTIDASVEDPREEIQRITRLGVNYAIDTTGVPQVLRTAVDSTAPEGQTAVIGAPAFGVEASFDVNTILVGGRTIRGIVEGDSVPGVFIPRLFEFWRAGAFPVERLMSSYSFDQIDEAAADAEAGRVIKPVLEMRSAA